MKPILLTILIALTASGADLIPNHEVQKLKAMVNDGLTRSFTNGVRFGYLLAARGATMEEALRVEFESRTNLTWFTNWAEAHPIQIGLSITNTVGFTTNQINTLATSGELCRVRGHVWQDYKPASETWTNMGVYFGPPRRKCIICSKTEVQVTEWK